MHFDSDVDSDARMSKREGTPLFFNFCSSLLFLPDRGYLTSVKRQSLTGPDFFFFHFYFCVMIPLGSYTVAKL